MVPLPTTTLGIESRVGIDLNPLNLEVPEERLWLRALIWPERRDRATHLDQAMKVLRRNPPRLVAGDALVELPRLVDKVPPHLTICLFSSFTFNQFQREGRNRFAAFLTEQGNHRKVFLLTLGYATPQDVELRLTTYEKGSSREERLARCAPHGGWVEWLGPRA